MFSFLLIIGLFISSAAQPVDLDRLAHAVAVAETSNCTRGTGVSKRNCHGIRFKAGGFRVFQTTDESFQEFKAMWPRVYGYRFPTYKDAQKYTANDKPDRWLATVTQSYNSGL